MPEDSARSARSSQRVSHGVLWVLLAGTPVTAGLTAVYASARAADPLVAGLSVFFVAGTVASGASLWHVSTRGEHDE